MPYLKSCRCSDNESNRIINNTVIKSSTTCLDSTKTLLESTLDNGLLFRSSLAVQLIERRKIHIDYSGL